MDNIYVICFSIIIILIIGILVFVAKKAKDLDKSSYHVNEKPFKRPFKGHGGDEDVR